MARAAVAGTVGSLTLAGVVAAGAWAQGADGHDGHDRPGVVGLRLTDVPGNPKATGLASPNVLSPELVEQAVAQGSVKLENPTADVPYYGYRGDGPLLPAPGDLPAGGHVVEASKTEPDKNTYLVLRGQHGADPRCDYGTHFVFQGHEAGKTGYLTRINLDADAAHRVTLLATTTINGTALPVFDGSTWDPWGAAPAVHRRKPRPTRMPRPAS